MRLKESIDVNVFHYQCVSYSCVLRSTVVDVRKVAHEACVLERAADGCFSSSMHLQSIV